MLCLRRIPTRLPAEFKPLLPFKSLFTNSPEYPTDGNGHDPKDEDMSDRSHWTKRIHSLCTTHGNIDEALRLLDRLRLRGYKPDSLNLSSIVHGLCDSCRFEEAHQRLLLSLASNWVPDDRSANVLIARLLDARTPHLSLVVFRQLVAAKPGFVPSLVNYNRLLDQFCHFSHPVVAHQVLEEMKNTGQFPNCVSYTTLIDGFGRVGDLMAARQMFDEMLKSGVPPNALTCSALLKGVLRNRRLEEGRELMGELWEMMAGENNFSVNNAAFANLVAALCREGFYHEVFRIAEEMPQGKCVNEEFAYGQMMDSLCRSGRNHGASRIVYIMRKRGFVPSLLSYNCIVHNLSKEGEGGCMRAYQLFREGIEFGYSPKEATYKILVEGLCRGTYLSKAKDVTEFMLQKEGVDKTRIYNIFLSALRLFDHPSEQLNVLVSMLQNQCMPDVVTLNTVIHSFCKIGKIDEAIVILNDMQNRKFCSPDAVTFTTIMGGLLDTGRMVEALNILRFKMTECHCIPKTVTYNAVLRGLCKHKEVDKAVEVYNEMAAKGVPADTTTYTILIDGLWEAGRVLEAKRFWDDVIWPSKKHDGFIYAAILRGLCNLGKLNEAYDFLYELIDCGINPGVINYNILIHSACNMGLKKEAYQIVGEMRKNGLAPDSVTWRILNNLHRDGKDGKKQNHVVKEEMRSVPIQPGYVNEHPTDYELCGVSEELNEPELINTEGTLNLEIREPEFKSIMNANISITLNKENTVNNNDGQCTVISSYELAQKRIKKNTFKMFDEEEPLSKMARRVFGLL